MKILLGVLFYFCSSCFGFSFDSIKMSWFEIRNVNLEIQQPLTDAEVTTWIPELRGKNLLFFSPKQLMTSLTGKPWVESIYIKKEFPHSLVVKVTTKEPKLILKSGKEFYFLDEEGKKIALATSANRSRWDLPLLTFTDEQAEEWDLNSFYQDLKTFEKKFPISEVSLGFFPEFSVYLKGRRIRVILEQAHLLTSMSKLEFLLKNPPKTEGPIRQIDLTNPKKAVVSSHLSK